MYVYHIPFNVNAAGRTGTFGGKLMCFRLNENENS